MRMTSVAGSLASACEGSMGLAPINSIRPTPRCRLRLAVMPRQRMTENPCCGLEWTDMVFAPPGSERARRKPFTQAAGKRG